ncbi:hypothetical protein [Polyangium sp. 6x1]|uniref:hypothetical protein n=1 Tax=Polyangium sp. 6x1 TaxID=3042689 RepID=UPI002482A524|nr:hypothetical protein [Polyangium sp. 6x1]MDI1444909.1 hypothetical protein [Polyangium sp. 6x1]
MKTRRFSGLSTLTLAISCAAAMALVPACSGESNPSEPSGPGVGGSGASGGSGGEGGAGGDAGAGGEGGASTPHTPEHVWTECQASDQAWVRRAITAVSGRKPWGQAEVNAYTDAITAIRKADLEAAGKFGELGDALPPYGDDLVNARKIVARALMREDAFRQRWSDFFMDTLRVNRIETKSLQQCYGSPPAAAYDNGNLAAWVRDNEATSKNPPNPGFTMNQLLSSALELDDLSPVYRGNLFAMMSQPYSGANVGEYEMERARRQNFGAIFERAYLHRDRVCLTCHNSEFSVTYSDDPALNRAWPVPGLFEVALYGNSAGVHPEEEQETKGTDEMRALSMLRYWGVADGGGSSPYGWSGNACGSFRAPAEDDPLGVDTYFGSIRSTPEAPNKGRRASVWDLERALKRGVDQLAAHGLVRLPGGELADPDEAFAYMVAQNIVDVVWSEVMGTRLTIANYFPRTEVQRDILMSLTEKFVASHFSLRELLTDILAHPAFNLKAPEEGCGSAAYEVPRIFDPWTIADKDLGRRGNSPADGVFAISSRPLRRSLHRAMEWPSYSEYPQDETEESFQLAIGFALKDAEPGFRGLDFQGRLSWEATYGACKPLNANDFISKIVQRAQATTGATVGDAVIALKDRLLGEPWVEPVTEKPQIEALVKSSLEDTNLAGLDAKLRSFCGVLVAAPQFMLGGVVSKDATDVPKLTPTEISYEGTCGYVSFVAGQIGAPYTITCGPGTITAKKQ